MEEGVARGRPARQIVVEDSDGRQHAIPINLAWSPAILLDALEQRGLRGARVVDVYHDPGEELIRSWSIALSLERCPDGRRCRLSDAAFIDYDQTIFGINGRIARPNTTCAEPGVACGIEMDRITDDIRIASGTSGLPIGTRVDKVGATSGWTSGTIIDDCRDVNVDRTNITLLCQVVVRTVSRPGDSGAPVFVYHSDTGAGEICWN